MNFARRLSLLLVTLFVPLSVGCYVPSQVYWSPDGSKAAYVNTHSGAAILMDADGKKLADLGKSAGGFAWSADNTTLYYCATAPAGTAPTAISADWSAKAGEPEGDVEDPDAPATATAPEEQNADAGNNDEPRTLFAFKDDESKALATLPQGTSVFYMTLSPDQKWLAALAYRKKRSGEERGDDGFLTYAVHVPTGALYLVSGNCSQAIAFTGPARLALIEPVKETNNAFGWLTEVVLDPDATHLERTHVLAVIPTVTPWIQPLGPDLLLTARPITFPAPPPDENPSLNLYLYTRANRSLTPIANYVGRFFQPSPDGKRILYEALTLDPDNNITRRELAVINANGSAARPLMDLTAFGEDLPLWPAWRNNSEISFLANPTTEGDRMFVDVVLYALDDAGELRPVKTLSESWEPELRPSGRKPEQPQENPEVPATQDEMIMP